MNNPNPASARTQTQTHEDCRPLNRFKLITDEVTCRVMSASTRVLHNSEQTEHLQTLWSITAAIYSPQLSTNVPYLNVFLIHQSRIHISLSLCPDLNCWPDRFAACYPECIDVRSLHHYKYHRVKKYSRVSFAFASSYHFSKLLANDSIFITPSHAQNMHFRIGKIITMKHKWRGLKFQYPTNGNISMSPNAIMLTHD